jgi:two-component sensor histidine kinase
MFDSVQNGFSARRNLYGRTRRRSYHNSNAGSSNVNTATRFHTGDRPRDLTTIATALSERRGSPNLRLEAAAWRQLAGALIADPSTALSCALDIALALCRAGTAGLSLLKTDAASGTTVRWELVHGALARYEGLDTPVSSSPCGLCLDADATILVSRPARAYAWLEDTRPSILEELIAPLRDSQGGVEGTLWIAHHDRRSRCSADDVRILEQLAQQIVLALRLQEHARDREHALSVLESLQAAQQDLLSHDLAHERTRRQQAEAAEHEARRALTLKQATIDEVNHRTKNTLQAAVGLLSLHARAAASPEVKRALLDSCDRLQLLAEVHAMISAAPDDGQTIFMPQLLQTLCDALRRSFGNIHHGVSLELTADAVSLPAADAIAIALLSNETVTNAYKHAFAGEAPGAITVRLHRTPEQALVLRITDSGVGADLADTNGHMGLKLMRMLAVQLRGTLEIEGHAGSAGTQVTLTMDRQSAAQLTP